MGIKYVKKDCVCPQAIRDGVIEATIDHERGWVQSKVIMRIIINYWSLKPVFI